MPPSRVQLAAALLGELSFHVLPPLIPPLILTFALRAQPPFTRRDATRTAEQPSNPGSQSTTTTRRTHHALLSTTVAQPCSFIHNDLPRSRGLGLARLRPD
jgi:hypothetical protein